MLINNIMECMTFKTDLQQAYNVIACLIDNCKDPICILDSEGFLIQHNDRYKKLINLFENNTLGLYNIFEDKVFTEQGNIHFINEAFKTGKPVQFEISTLAININEQPSVNGKPIEFTVYVTPILNSDGLVANVLVKYTDNTERQEIENLKKNYEFILHTVYNNLDVGIAITDEGGKIIDCNKASEKITGISKEDQYNRNYNLSEWKIIHRDYSQMPHDEFAKERAIKEKKEIRNVVMGVIKNSEEPIWISVNAAPINVNGYGVVISYIDITENIKLQEDLIRRERNHSIIKDNLPVFISHIDSDCNFVYVNKLISEIFGKKKEDIINKSLADLLGEQHFSKIKKYIQSALSGETVKYIDNIVDTNNKEYTLQITLIPEIVDSIVKGIFTLGLDVTELQQVEDALKEREFEINELQQVAGLGSWTFDPYTMTAKWSTEMYNIFGIDKSITSIDYTLHYKIIHIDSIQIFEDAIKDAIEFGKPFVCDLRCLKEGKTEINVVTTGEAIVDKNGKVILLKGTIRDVTEKRKLVAAMQESEMRFKNIFAKHKSVMFLINPKDLHIVDANEAAAEFYGYSIHQLRKMYINEINLLVFENNKDKLINETLKTKVSSVFPHRLASGELRTVEVFSSTISYKGENILFSIIHDITERKKVEDELIENKEKYQMIFDSVGDPIVIHDENGKILAANNAATIEYGFSTEEFLQIGIRDLLSIDSRGNFNERLAKLISNKHIYINTMHQRKDKSILYINVNTKQILYKNKIAFLGVIRNTTALKEAELIIEEKNNELQKINNEKDKFFSIIAHDLKSPFNSVLSLSEMLQQSLEEKNYDEVNDFTKMIVQSTIKATNLLKNLLDWSRAQTGGLTYSPIMFDMVSIISEITNLYNDIANQKSISIINNLPKILPVNADKDMISTVLRNLLSNAIKFTHKGGTVTLHADKSTDEIIIKIIDTGVGIPEKAIEKLFKISNKYSTSGTQNEQGTGLGLILCKDFIDKHKGKIWVESKEGVGSTFVVTIPLN